MIKFAKADEIKGIKCSIYAMKKRWKKLEWAKKQKQNLWGQPIVYLNSQSLKQHREERNILTEGKQRLLLLTYIQLFFFHFSSQLFEGQAKIKVERSSLPENDL